MFGNRKNSNDPLTQCDYGNFSLRFKPVDIKFTKPNWDNIMTKRDKPVMSEEEFEEAIKELARKEFSTGKRDDAAYRKLCMQHEETVSPDRKAIYESSMKKTGGKMNAACMFCLKGQTLIQNKPSVSEGYFSASLEKALFCGFSWILSFSMFGTGFPNFHRIMNFETTRIALYWQMHTPWRADETKPITAKKYYSGNKAVRTF